MHRFFAVLAFHNTLAHPNNLECNDPRFDPGNQAMFVEIVNNKYDKRLKFEVNSQKYKHGQEIRIDINAAIDDTYTRDDGAGGVFLALRARPVLGYASDYGQFTSMSKDFVPSADGDADCANQIYSGKDSNGSWMPFKGSSHAVWKAGEMTYGDVELVLLWGNGVGPDDPLSHLFPNLTHAYLFRRVITLKGPKMPDVPPFRRLAAVNQCVATGRLDFNMPHSPVFIQNLRTFPEKSVTFPSGRCLSCREDQRNKCRSALVECPTMPGALAVEKLFNSADCTGEELSSTKLSVHYARCPGPDYYSPYKLDLERFVKKAMRDHPSYFPDEQTARSAIAEYRRMLQLIQKFPDAPVVPSKLVDLIWHEHILDTQEYKEDSQRMFGRYIHHAPAFGDDEDEAVKTQKEGMLAEQAEMFQKYVQLFETEPPTEVWPTARKLGGNGRLPDCCQALCVKPECVSCVGCNAVDCGKFEATLTQTEVKHVLPDTFAGYVPVPRSIAENMLSLDQDHLCSVTPMHGMTLSWTISGDDIFMQQTLDTHVAETWHAIGFTDVEPFNMGYSDFIVSFFGESNYTGVRDLYKFDAGNNYPCWDVLHQCSADGQSAGTLDLFDRVNDRKGGMSTSSWRRPLVTGDAKDSEITETSKKVMFAYGKSDHFTYHAKNQTSTCNVNFFTGESDCGASFV